MAQKSPANPYGVCNFDPDADCESCLVNTRLFCHFDIKDVWRFLALFLIPIVAIWIGPVLRGEWGLLVAWIAVGFFFLQVPENYILCRHCPYYAQGERRTLLCHANAGLLKLLNVELPAQADGVTVKVRLQTRRNDGTAESPSWIYSEDSTIESIINDATGPSVPLHLAAWPGI